MKTGRHNAIAKCNKCESYIMSTGGGRFASCKKCGESFIDQERWSGAYVRTSNATFIEQICPANCEHGEEHSKNKKFNKFEDLQKYILETYKLDILK